MGHQVNAKHWIIREQIVADQVSGLTLEFTVMKDGTPCLSLYGDCLVFRNRTIVFENDGETVHGETAIPSDIPSCRQDLHANEDGDRGQGSYRSRLRAAR